MPAKRLMNGVTTPCRVPTVGAPRRDNTYTGDDCSSPDAVSGDGNAVHAVAMEHGPDRSVRGCNHARSGSARRLQPRADAALIVRRFAAANDLVGHSPSMFVESPL
jgi:hypothetical protein